MGGLEKVQNYADVIYGWPLGRGVPLCSSTRRKYLNYSGFPDIQCCCYLQKSVINNVGFLEGNTFILHKKVLFILLVRDLKKLHNLDAKGQLISKGNFGVFNSSKKQT